MADENHSDFSEPNDLEFFSDDDLNDSIDQLVEPEKSAEMNWKDKLVCFSGFKITTFINKNGEEKKKLNLPAWKEITKPQTYKEGTAQAIRTGKWSGISVIDFDDLDIYNDMCEKFVWIKEQPAVKTRKGFHIYAKYNPELKQYGMEVRHSRPELLFWEGGMDANPTKAKIDIQQDSEIVISPPSQYKTKDGQTHTYEWVNDEKELSEIPQELIDYLNPEETKNKLNPKTNTKKPKKLKVKVKEGEEVQKFPESSSNEPVSEIKEIIDLICKYNEKYPYHYNEWFKIMCGCYGAGQTIDQVSQYREFAHKISQASSKYDEKDTNLKFNEGCKFNYTEGTLRHYAKEAFPDEYREIIRKNANLSGKCLFEERELRDYFLRMWGDNVFTFRMETDIFYIWIEAESRWIIDNGSQLKYHIIEQIYILFEENLKNFEIEAKAKQQEYYSLMKKYPEPTEEQQKEIR